MSHTHAHTYTWLDKSESGFTPRRSRVIWQLSAPPTACQGRDSCQKRQQCDRVVSIVTQQPDSGSWQLSKRETRPHRTQPRDHVKSHNKNILSYDPRRIIVYLLPFSCMNLFKIEWLRNDFVQHCTHRRLVAELGINRNKRTLQHVYRTAYNNIIAYNYLYIHVYIYS